MKTLLSLLLLPFLLLPIACSKSKSKPAISKYFYHGDPLEMLAGSTKNAELGFSVKDYLQFEGYELSVMFIISEKSERETSFSETAEEGNEATTDLDTSMKGSSFSFSNLKDNKLTFSGLYQEMNISLVLNATKSGSLQIESVAVNGEAASDIQLQHYSETKDKRQFSLLLSAKDEDGSHLIAMYFVKEQNFDLVKQGDKKYFFIEGQGVMFGWDKTKDVEVNLCVPKGKTLAIKGSHATFNLPVSMTFVSEWQKALDSRLNLKYGEKNQYPPFSDLNSHCIYILDSYIRNQNPQYLNYGMAITITDASKSQIVDSDIFLNAEEFAKQLKIEHPRAQTVGYHVLYAHFEKTLSYTISHEFGHFLGLDHVFDGTSSIMSYEFEEAKLSPFDVESIQYLYN